jgi:hypothetical protein
MAIKAANITSIVKTSSAIVNRGKNKSAQQVKPSIQLVSKPKANTQNQGIGGALVKKDSFNVGNFGSTSTNESSNNVGLEENVIKIKIKVISIEKLLRGTVALQKKQINERRSEYQKKSRTENEDKLEKTPKNDTDTKKLPSLPGMGFLEGIKNFFLNMIIGWFALKMIDYLPQFTSFLKILAPAVDFLIDFSGKFLDGLVTFVDWGYKAYDFTRKAVKDIGGLGAEKAFDQFSSKLDTFINLAIIAGMIAANSGGNKPKIKSRVRPKPGERFRSKVTESGGRRAGSGFDVRNPLRERSVITEGRGGRGGFRLPEILGGKPKAKVSVGGSAEKGLFGKISKGIKLSPKASGALKFAGRGLEVAALIPTVFEVVDLVKQKKYKDAARTIISAGLSIAVFEAVLGATGAAAIAEEIFSGGLATPAAIATLLGGGVLSVGASAGTSMASDALLKKLGLEDKQQKMAGGGAVTRGGKITGGIQRTVGTIKRKLTFQKPPKKQVEPGSKIGGEDKIKKLFPEGKDKEMNPFGFLKNTAESFNNVDYLGPIFGLVTKSILGEKIEADDYRNVGMGINAWISRGINDGKLNGQLSAAFANGGVVDIQNVIPDSNDISDWAQQSAKDLVATKISSTSKDLLQNLLLQQQQKGNTDLQDTPDAPLEGASNAIELAARVAKRLMNDFGLTDFQAAGAVGNLLNEGMGGGTGDVHQGGTRGAPRYDAPITDGYGWAQWTNTEGGGPRDRLNRALIYLGMKDNPKPWSNDDDYKVLKWELQGPYKFVIDELKKTKSVDEATMTWLTKFEGINDGTGPKRIASAKQVLPRVAGVETTDFTTGMDANAKIDKSGVQYITGDPNDPHYRKDHGGGNYHDHLGFANPATATKAFDFFKSKGFKVTEFKPITGVTGSAHNTPGDPHYENLAFDIPGYQWGGSGAIGPTEYRGSAKVRSALAQFESAKKNGGLVGKNYKNLQSYASYEDGSAMTVIVNTAMILPQSANNGNSSPMNSTSSKSSHHDPFEILQRLPG